MPVTTRRTAAPGGGTVVEVAADRLIGWVNRFGGRNAGVLSVVGEESRVRITGGNGTVADLAVPFGPMARRDREPLEALLDHLAALGELGIVLVRGGAHSVGVAGRGVVLRSSTDRAYLQGRTAAGGWSQQRFARRRGNQRTASLDSAADTVARLLLPVASELDGMVLGGDRAALTTVMADARLTALNSLPSRTFPDIAEPRRAVLDDVAARSLAVSITVTQPQGDR